MVMVRGEVQAGNAPPARLDAGLHHQRGTVPKAMHAERHLQCPPRKERSPAAAARVYFPGSLLFARRRCFPHSEAWRGELFSSAGFPSAVLPPWLTQGPGDAWGAEDRVLWFSLGGLEGQELRASDKMSLTSTRFNLPTPTIFERRQAEIRSNTRASKQISHINLFCPFKLVLLLPQPLLIATVPLFGYLLSSFLSTSVLECPCRAHLPHLPGLRLLHLFLSANMPACLHSQTMRT